METYEVIILCLFNLISFIVGAKIGQHSARGKDITINPIKAIKNDIKEGKENKRNDLEKRKIETMFENIDKYDGTGLGQTTIPKE